MCAVASPVVGLPLTSQISEFEGASLRSPAMNEADGGVFEHDLMFIDITGKI